MDETEKKNINNNQSSVRFPKATTATKKKTVILKKVIRFVI